ncbi:MAG: hypothetical protein AAE975_03235 [Thermoplasmatales archaeon]
MHIPKSRVRYNTIFRTASPKGINFMSLKFHSRICNLPGERDKLRHYSQGYVTKLLERLSTLRIGDE